MSEENPEIKNQAEISNKSQFRLSEGLLIALISSGSYLLTFQYEKGYAAYFGIPSSFINLSLTNVLYIAALLTGFILSAFPFANILTIVLFSNIIRNQTIASYLFITVMLAIMAFFPAYIFGSWVVFIVSLIMFLMYVGIIFIIPLIAHRKKGSYIKRLEAQAEIDLDPNIINLFDLISFKFGKLGTLLILLFIISVSFASTAGSASAINQEEFLVNQSKPEMVLLRTYGDNLIFAPFDRNTKEVQKSFVVLKVAADPKLILSLEKIGPLKPVESKPILVPSLDPTPSNTPSPEPTISPVQK